MRGCFVFYIAGPAPHVVRESYAGSSSPSPDAEPEPDMPQTSTEGTMHISATTNITVFVMN